MMMRSHHAHLQPFRVVHQAGEHDDAQHQEKHEQRQLLGRRFERVDEYLQPGRVPRQFEQPQYANDGEKFQYFRVVETVGQRALEHRVRVEAQRGHEVDDVHRRLGEVREIGRHL